MNEAAADEGVPSGFENAANVLRSRAVPADTKDLITRADNPLHVAEYFGRKPDDLRAVLQLSPIERAMAIARLDGLITANLKTPQRPPVTTTPPPPAPAPQVSPAATPTSLGSGGGAPFNPETAPVSEFKARLARGPGGKAA